MLTRGLTGCLAVILAGILGCGGLSNGGDRKPDAAAKGEGAKAALPENLDAANIDPANFDNSSTTIDNEWWPLKPGTQMTWEGSAFEDDEKVRRKVVFTVTDMTKEIAGVRTLVGWDRDYVNDELTESELTFLAQAKDGSVWHLGECVEHYQARPEIQSKGHYDGTRVWLAGYLKGCKAGIYMPAAPKLKLGAPPYSQGFAPHPWDWDDWAEVYQVGQKTSVRAGSYSDVLVIREYEPADPDVSQLKYYARGVGCVRIGWLGETDEEKETLELVKHVTLTPKALAEVRAAVLAIEGRANMYSLTPPVKIDDSLTPPAQTNGSDTAAVGDSPTPQQPQTEGKENEKQQTQQELGTEEFGLSKKGLVQAIEKVEALIAKSMREQGFEYVAADYATVRRGMTADKSLPGVSKEEFIEKHGFGVATLYTGQPPQLSDGYSPAKAGLGERNIQIYKGLSPADQAAYNRALFGENSDASFAVGLEREDFSRCGGCTLKAIQQVFKSDELKATYYNPKDAMINKDPRMKAALRKYADAMRKAGYDYNHPDEVEPDVLKRLYAITDGGKIPVEKLSPEQRGALAKLQDYERMAAKTSSDLQEEYFDPVEEEIEKEHFARDVK